MNKYTLQRIRLRKVIGKYPLKINQEFIIGRSDKHATIVLQNESISRQHAKIIVTSNGSVSIQDLDSANGTFVDDNQIKTNQIVMLKDLSEIKLGQCEDILKIVENPEFNLKNIEKLQIKQKERSRSRSNEKKEKCEQKTFQKQEKLNEPWNALDINTQDKERFMRLMGVKNVEKYTQKVDQDKVIGNQIVQGNLEKQFYQAKRDGSKRGLGL